MKHIMSVSLGSSRRDHAYEGDFLGERFLIERRGTDGDWSRAVELVRSYDGKVDAFGMGGVDLHLHFAGKSYEIKAARRLQAEARKSPMMDGGGLKSTLEKKCILDLQKEGVIDFQNRQVLLVSGVDRYGMAEAFAEIGAPVKYGDLVYSLGIPMLIGSLNGLKMAGKTLLPIIVRLPFEMIYPTGDNQDKITPRHPRFYHQAEVIAGDFHYIRRFLPDFLNGQIILTNTTTEEDVALLKERGASMLINTTPDMGGRSFGTNVIEALIIALTGRSPSEMDEGEYYRMIEELGLKPRMTFLQ